MSVPGPGCRGHRREMCVSPSSVGRRAWSSAAAFFVCLAVSSILPAGEIGGLDAYVEGVIGRWKTPGTAVVVVKDDHQVYCRGFGRCRAGGKERVKGTTLFPLASPVKGMTAMLAAMLVHDGKLSWDRPVRDVLPEFHPPDQEAAAHCTIRDLLSHRSGLGRHEALWYRRSLSREQLLPLVGFLRPEAAFRDRFAYSNLDFMVAGMVEEKVAGVSWEMLLSERILRPLGMKATSISMPPGDIAGVAAEHRLDRLGRARVIEGVDSPAMRPAFSVWTTAEDTGRWLRCLLDSFHGGLLDRTSFEFLLRPVIPMPWVGSNESPMASYGLGWMITSYRGYRVFFHTGTMEGATSIVLILPDAGIGIAVLSNLAPSRVPEIIAWRMADLLLHLNPVDWESRFAAQEGIVRSGRRPEMPPVGEVSAEILSEALPGVYRNRVFGELEISRNGAGHPELSFRGLRGRMERVGGNLFAVELDSEVLGRRLWMRFIAGDGAHAAGCEFSIEAPAVVFTFASGTPDGVISVQPGDSGGSEHSPG